MSEREKILGRIREALRVEAPLPGSHSSSDLHTAPRAPQAAATHARKWLPAVPEALEDRIELFRSHSLDLKSDFRRVADVEALPALLKELAAQYGWKRLASHRNPLNLKAIEVLGMPTLMTDEGYDVNALEACDVGITGCDALIAQTGSVLLTSRSAGGRALSVLPPHHLVLARLDQMLPDLPASFELLARSYGQNYPSFMSIVTGPSRTGDIERILVLGAHGPKQLTVVLVG
jgi:L-lactate dehydrogenase complex protein LldG